MDKNEKIFAAVDIGSTKIVALAGKKNEEGKIQIIGLGHSASRGVNRGVVLNVEEAYAAISDAVGQAERDCGREIDNVFVNISGQQLTTLTARLQKSHPKGHLVTDADINLMMEQARMVNSAADMSIYHLNPECYTIDGEQVGTSPVGSIGEKVEGIFKVHIAPDSYLQYIEKCFDGGDVRVHKAILDPIASAEVVLLDDEKEAGVALVDIGGGTTKISIFCEGVLCFTSMVPFGGNVITRDIKEGCSITAKQAESLKVQFGHAIADFAPEGKMVTIPIPGGWEPKHISVKSLSHIIQARMEEIISGFFVQIRKSGYADKLGAGIVITGGTSLLRNLPQLIKFHTGLDVKIGHPNLNNFAERKEVNDPRFATVLGLLKMAVSEDGQVGKGKRIRIRKPKSNEPGYLEKTRLKLVQGVISFFEENPADTEMD